MTGVSSSQTCNLQELPSPHSVHAYDEQPVSCLSGCVGVEPDTKVPEVHIINLRLSSSSVSSTSLPADSQSNPLDIIDFNFKSKNTGIFARSLVFVLNSATPVRWRVKGENLFPFPLYTIQIVVSRTNNAWNFL